MTLLHNPDDPDSASRSSFASLPALGLSNKPMVEGGTTGAPQLPGVDGFDLGEDGLEGHSKDFEALRSANVK